MYCVFDNKAKTINYLVNCYCNKYLPAKGSHYNFYINTAKFKNTEIRKVPLAQTGMQNKSSNRAFNANLNVYHLYLLF